MTCDIVSIREWIRPSIRIHLNTATKHHSNKKNNKIIAHAHHTMRISPATSRSSCENIMIQQKSKASLFLCILTYNARRDVILWRKNNNSLLSFVAENACIYDFFADSRSSNA